MNGFNRLIGSGWAALLVWRIGAALDVPMWRDGWAAGDRADMALAAFMAAWFLTARDKK